MQNAKLKMQNFKFTELRDLHPDTNGGDHSRVGELQTLLCARRRICQCGCRAALRYGRKKFLDAMHFQAARRGRSVRALTSALLLFAFGIFHFALAAAAPRLRSPKDAGLAADAPMLRALAALPLRTTTLLWDNAPGAFITDAWGTTTLLTWYAVGSVTNTNAITLPRLQPAEFYRVSHPNRPGHRWDGSAYTPD